jgi:hypothetical protein
MVRMLLHLTQVLFISLIITSCKKTDGNAPDIITSPIIDSNVSVTNKTATSFTLTWQPAVDDATVAGNLMYKVAYSLSDNVSDAGGAELNGLVAMPWTANVTTTNLSALTNSTTYYIAILVKDADDHISLVNTNVITLCVGKRMFLATAPNGAFGGKTGGDSLCNAQKPVGLGTVKAMISDSTGVNGSGMPTNTSSRQACYGNCRSSNLYIYDWVFATGQRYCTSDYTKKVGDAGATYPVLYTTEANTLSATPILLYTGFNIQFANTGTNCNNWTSTVNSFVAGTTAGLFTATDSAFITGGATSFPSCTTPASIVCVEQ